MPGNILKYAAKGNASDIHITQNKPAWLRQNGEFKQHEYIATVNDIDKFVESFMPDMLCQYHKFKNRENTCPIDCAFQFMNRRFRANIYYSLSGMNVALRLLSDKIMPLEKLLMPDNVTEFITPHNGLILVAGKRGSGKTTTLASMIDAINHSRCENFLTIEEPIEYIHKSDLSRIEQIEVGVHAESFEAATIAALRQNPNIILIGEMRDLPTIQNAITLAETGHMVYGTLHAKSITETIDRIIDVFPSGQQEQIRQQLASVLKGILHQTLVRGINGNVIPIVEQLIVDDTVSSMIMQRQKPNAIRDYLRGKSKCGNVHIADNVAWHIQSSRLEVQTIKHLLSPDDYNMVKAILANFKTRGGFDG
ncbi:MAG: Flp pilus assembly complex ATPase component TadA [Clostridiaceae bacterium]|nr:Flp pilus assembly complex ATPase component TadA [Clostridiaceae bacterium]